MCLAVSAVKWGLYVLREADCQILHVVVGAAESYNDIWRL